MGKEIESGKVELKDLFDDFWFLVPEYQRPYVWSRDNVLELLEDLWFAFENNPNDEYFVGTLVLKKTRTKGFTEFEVIDGQQRLTTFGLIFSVIREITKDDTLKRTLSEYLHQEENPYKKIPERHRIVYRIRGHSDDFLKQLFKYGGENKHDKRDISVKNMIEALKTIRGFFLEKIEKDNKTDNKIEKFAEFILNNVVLVYIATDNRDDAFRLFTILNNRGIPLTNADILKAVNIGEIEAKEGDEIAKEYAKKWEEIQNELGDDFDRFLGYIRTILVKEKARKSLVEEFEEKIYKNGKLKKGTETIDLIEEYYSIYSKIIDFSTNELPLDGQNLQKNNAYKNLVTIMKFALPSTEWIPPLIHFYKKFGSELLLDFLKRLEFKFSSDWILYFTPTQRIENMNRILREIDRANTAEEIISNDGLFNVDIGELKKALSGDVYRKRFAKYVLLKYEYLVQDNTQFISNYSQVSIEHILPQNPPKNSLWREWFSDEEIEKYTHKIGNLVLLNRRKNSALSNLDFEKKKERYLKGSLSMFPSINHIMQKTQWKKEDIEERSRIMIEKLTNTD